MQKSTNSINTFIVFCDETRLKVLELLQSGEKSASSLLKQVCVGQSTLSHHMKVLAESGIINVRKVGKWAYYSIREGGGQKAIEMLKRLTNTEYIKTH